MIKLYSDRFTGDHSFDEQTAQQQNKRCALEDQQMSQKWIEENAECSFHA